MWDSGNITNHFEANILPFELKFRLPKLRKWRIILERDEFGRIIHSKAPQLYLDNISQKSLALSETEV